MTWAENEFSSVVKTMKGYFNEINKLEKRSSPKEGSISSCNSLVESKNSIQQLISRNEEPMLKPFGTDLMKMHKHNGTQSAKNFLKRSQSSTAEDSNSPEFIIRSSCLRLKNTNIARSQSTFPSKFENVENQGGDVEYAFRGAYQDDAFSTNSESSPLLPPSSLSCSEAHENEVCCSDSSSSCASVLASNDRSRLRINLDSLSICEDAFEDPPRISKMIEQDRRKTKPSAKSLYNIKSCSESDNKELNAAIQVAQNASSCLGPPHRKVGLQRASSAKRFLRKASHSKEDRRTFFEDSRLHQDYRSTINEQLTYNELVTKPNLSFDPVRSVEDAHERFPLPGQARNRKHSSLSDSENFLCFCGELRGGECLLTSRSDGTEICRVDDAKAGPACSRCKSDASPARPSKRFPMSVATSSRSLPTSLECHPRSFLLERQISTPLPNSFAPTSELEDPDRCPPLPSKGRSRSNLSSDDLTNQSPVGHTHPSLRPNVRKSSSNHLERSLLSPISQDETANNAGAIRSGCSTRAQNSNESAVRTLPSPPPLPSRTFPGATPLKGPPLPPKGAPSLHGLARRRALCSHRPNSEESDNIEESSSSCESSNFTSSIDSEGFEQYSETCLCKQVASIEAKYSQQCHANCDGSTVPSVHERDLMTKKANAPMPGRYETSDSLVYDYIGNASFDFPSSECRHMTDKVATLKRHLPEVSTNDLECALIENDYNIEEVLKHSALKSALVSSRCQKDDATSCLVTSHRSHFVRDPMEV